MSLVALFSTQAYMSLFALCSTQACVTLCPLHDLRLLAALTASFSLQVNRLTLAWQRSRVGCDGGPLLTTANYCWLPRSDRIVATSAAQRTISRVLRVL